MPRRRALSLLARAIVTAGLSLWPARADAEGAPAPAAPATFEYAQPYRRTYLRAVLEQGAITAFGFLWYVTNVRRDWDLGYQWDTFDKKLTLSNLGHDNNAFGTNLRGHPVAGTSYYLSARGNRLSILESFGYALAGSVLWEYFGEISEQVSLNDLIITPLSGIAIGEPLTQLGGYFDRSPATPANRALGTLFGPIKTLNDRFDGQSPRRAQPGHGFDEWHRFGLALGAARLRERGTHGATHDTGELRLELDETLARIAGYAGAARRSDVFDEANLSSLSLAAAFSEQGVSDFAFRSSVVLVGYATRHARWRAGRLRGGGSVTGLEIGYSYLLHDYRRAERGPLDRLAYVQPLGLLHEYRGSLGWLDIRSRVEAGLIYGATHAFALDAFRASLDAFPDVIRLFGYYFGAGGELSSRLELAVDRLSGTLAVSTRVLRCVDERVHVPIVDRWSTVELGLAYRMSGPVSLRAFGEQRLRTGRMAEARASASELGAGLGLHAQF